MYYSSICLEVLGKTTTIRVRGGTQDALQITQVEVVYKLRYKGIGTWLTNRNASDSGLIKKLLSCALIIGYRKETSCCCDQSQEIASLFLVSVRKWTSVLLFIFTRLLSHAIQLFLLTSRSTLPSRAGKVEGTLFALKRMDNHDVLSSMLILQNQNRLNFVMENR